LCLFLRLPVVSRGTDFVKGRRYYRFEKRSAELSWRQVGLLTQSLQRHLSMRACVRAYLHVVCVCVYMCMYVCARTCIYVYICMCIFIGIRMHVYTCVYVSSCMFVHRLSLSSRSSACLNGVIDAHVYSCGLVCVCICVYVYVYVHFFCSECCVHFRIGVLGTSACAVVCIIQMIL